MSVLIKGMDMPKHCGECGIEWCNKWKQLIVAGMSIAKTRPSDCPLVPVPPHGRLIDADALERDVQDLWMQNEISNGDWIGFREMLNGVPTIIPAEEGEG